MKYSERKISVCILPLTLSRRRPLSYRNQTSFYMITASVLKGLKEDMVHMMTTKTKLHFTTKIIRGFPLFKSDMALRNARWIYNGMIPFRMVAPQHIYNDQLKVVAKTVAKHAHLNRPINIEIVNDHVVKGVIRWTCGGGRFYTKDAQCFRLGKFFQQS